MRFIWNGVLLFFLFLSLLGCRSLFVSNDQSPKQNLIFDTDMAMDDWLALAYLAAHPNVNLLAVTVSGPGEASCQDGMRNALNLLDHLGRAEVPVFCGSEKPMGEWVRFPDAWVKLVNKFFGIKIPESRRVPEKRDAVEALTEIIESAAQPPILLATGPLTNLGRLFKNDPSIHRKISKVVVMGGALSVPGNIRVPGYTEHLRNHVAEWNIYVDPLSLDWVLRSGVSLFLVPLDVTNKVRVSEKFIHCIDQQKAISKPLRFVRQSLEKSRFLIETGHYYFWDPMAAVFALSRAERLFDFKKVSVVVDTKNYPQDYKDEKQLDTYGQIRIAKEGRSLQYVYGVRSARMLNEYFGRLYGNSEGYQSCF